MSAGDWCLLESDPGLFSALIREFGSRGTQVDELWGLEPEVSRPMGKIYGLIFLFKWDGKTETQSQGAVVNDQDHPELFFARQMINNACGTQALLSVLLNIKDEAVKLGDTLQNFHDFAVTLDAESRGYSLSNSEEIRAVHNSFSRQQLFEMDDVKAPKDKDLYHFVSYVPVNGRLWELDGLQRGPIDHGKIEDSDDWMNAARPVIQARMNKYSSNEVGFCLLAVCEDKLDKLNAELNGYKEKGNDYMASETQRDISNEVEKRLRFTKDNIRRRHNFLPLVIEVIKSMAAEGKLTDAVNKAEEKTKKAIERRANMKSEK